MGVEIAPEPATHRRGRSGGRDRSGGRGVTVLCWLLALLPAAWAVVRVFGWERGPLVQLLAFTPYVAGGAVAVTALTLALRRRGAAAVAVVATVALAACVLPRAFASGGDDAAGRAGGPVVRMLTANLLAGAADPAAVVALVRQHRVDVLAVQEFTPDAAAAFDALGLTRLMPHRQILPEVGTTGSALYSRHPLADGGVRRNGGGFAQAYATVRVPGAAPVVVESAHPAAPHALSALDDWRADLDAQPRATPDGPVRVLLGDFNATLDHAPLRRLVASGYVDAADAAGQGFAGTWGPYDGDPIPPVTIDHVLVDRRVGVRELSVHPLPGSDHRPVLAELSLPVA